MSEDSMYTDPSFREFMNRLNSLSEEARGKGYVEAYIVLATLTGSILAGQLSKYANVSKVFAAKMKDELQAKKPKRKLNFDADNG